MTLVVVIVCFRLLGVNTRIYTTHFMNGLHLNISKMTNHIIHPVSSQFRAAISTPWNVILSSGVPNDARRPNSAFVIDIYFYWWKDL